MGVNQFFETPLWAGAAPYLLLLFPVFSVYNYAHSSGVASPLHPWGSQPMAEKKFETALARLEDIVKELEKGDIPLEQSLKLFEEGVRLSRLCTKRLGEAGRKVEVLMNDGGGNLSTQPFTEDEE